MPSDLSQIFGSASAGIIAYACALILIYNLRARNWRIVPWAVKNRYLPRQAAGVALASLLAFGAGVVIEDVTDHLTDSEYRAFCDVPLWPPHLQHAMLGSEGHHRVRTLFLDKDNLSGLGRQVLASTELRQAGKTAYAAGIGPSDAPLRLAQAEEFYAYPVDFRKGTTTLAASLPASLSFSKTPAGIAEQLVNSMYYEAKNWAYINAISINELMSVQRRIDFCRSVFLIATWFMVFGLFVWTYQAFTRRALFQRVISPFLWVISLFLRRNVQPPRVISASQSTQLIKAGVTAAALAFLGWLGYAESENNFNERVFGYYLTKYPVAEDGSGCADWRLGATLWQQHSAEYAALCLAIYESAGSRLQASGVAAGTAIVMDLDETVLDNSGFQAEQILRHEKFSQELWDEWERKGGDRVRLVPGATEFIRRARKLGYAVIFISNRSEARRSETLDLLERLDVMGGELTADRAIAHANSSSWLLLRTEDSSKALRLRRVRDENQVVMILGDNLADFDAAFDATAPRGGTLADQLAAAEDRTRLVLSDESRDPQGRLHWGHDWFVLPNPIYGDWTKPFTLGEPSLYLRH